MFLLVSHVNCGAHSNLPFPYQPHTSPQCHRLVDPDPKRDETLDLATLYTAV